MYLRTDPPEVRYLPKGSEHGLERVEVRDLTWHYPESGRGIEGISVVLERGSFTVVTGRIGSGKTTLLEVLLGLLPREAGEVLWNGRVVKDLASFLVPPRCAYVPQVPALFSDPLRENLLLGLPEDWAGLEAALRLAVMERDVERLERGLDTLVGPRGVRLSGGQLQRVGAARAFLRRPELLVVDDLSSALDVETEAELWRRIRGQEGLTVLAVSHRRAALEIADRVVVLREGSVVAQGALEPLLERSEEMRHLWATERDGVGAS